MTTSRRIVVFVLVTLLCGVFATGCDDIVTDPNFHTWCGDQLCSWKLESGKIQRAPTWHPKDFGVELLDSTDANHTTAISQVSSTTAKCLEFSTVADVAVEAQVSIGLDFDNDGTIDYEQAIAATGFIEQKTQITAPLAYTNIRFVIAKKGTGRAVLAQMDVSAASSCTAPPVALTAQVQGTACSVTGDGSECISGICCAGLCAECCTSTTCTDGATCGAIQLVVPGRLQSSDEGLGGAAVPRQCDPGKRKRPAHSECLLDEDCTSGACNGAVWNIEQHVINGPACPAPPTLIDDCRVTSVRGGRCQ